MTATRNTDLPDGFIWGTATSAYQVEGGNYAADWWEWERDPGSGCVEPCLDACDHYHRYPDDIATIAALGFNAYRFSIEWSRVEPEPGEFSRAQLEHYRRMLECCHAGGLRPIPTFHHFTSPRWVARAGGWESPGTAERFARYCEITAAHLRDLFDLAITINEPNMPALLGYQDGIFPPGKRDPQARAAADATFIRAHRLARDAIRSRAEARVGVALAMVDLQPVDGGEQTLERIRRAREDIYLEATAEDDFVGVNAYTRHEVGPEGIRMPRPGAETTVLGWEYWPQSLAACLRRAAEVTGKPLIATENGIGTNDDARRIDYIRAALEGLVECLADGIDVGGYIYWSALDNFEWSHGYGPRFGLISVDRKTQQRTVKDSGRWLGELARSNRFVGSV